MINNQNSFGQVRTVIKILKRSDNETTRIIKEAGANAIRKTELKNSSIYNDFTRKEMFNKSLSPEEFNKLLDREVNAGRLSHFDALRMKKTPAIIKLQSKSLDEYKSTNAFKGLKPLNYIKPVPITLKQIKNSDVFISIPSTELEYKAIFGNENFDKNQFNNIVKLQKRLFDEKNPHAYFPKASDQLLNELTQNRKQEKSFIIIGHNDDGLLKFSDGSSLELKKIDSVANSLSRVAVLLSCKSSTFIEKNPATSYYLTYNEAVKLVHRIDSKAPEILKNDKEIVKEKIQAILDNYGKEQKLKFQLQVIFCGTAISSIGYGLYEIKSDKKSKIKLSAIKN